LVTKHSLREIPASWSIRSSSNPDAPTKGFPESVSVSPGASPTIMILALGGPEPGIIASPPDVGFEFAVLGYKLAVEIGRAVTRLRRTGEIREIPRS
jgi:hypothetical protein